MSTSKPNISNRTNGRWQRGSTNANSGDQLGRNTRAIKCPFGAEHHQTPRQEKNQIISEVVNNLQYNREYVIQVLNRARLKSASKRTRPLKYRTSLHVTPKIWQALGYICAERLHPVMSNTIYMSTYSSQARS